MLLEYSLRSTQRRKYIIFPLLKLLGVIVAATVVGVLWVGVRTDELIVIVGFTWAWIFLMHLLPLLIIAVRHSRHSANSSFAIDTVNHTYHYKQKDHSLSFRISEIDRVVKVVSPPKYDSRMDILGFGYFFYWKIELTNGRILSLSCMLLDADDFIGKKATLQKQLFPIPPSNENISRR